MSPLAHQLLAIARAAIAACHGEPLCARAYEELGIDGPVELVGAGKAAVAMGWGVTAALEVRSGLLCTKDEDGFVPAGVEVRWAGHPLPDRRSEAAADGLLQRLALAEQRVVAVLSGGASALLSAPSAGLTLDELRRVHECLLGAGVSIADINVVRKHLTRASGGRLARVCRMPVDVLVLSDVLGADLSAIGSGPFAPDASRFEEALGIVSSVPDFPTAARSLLERGARGDIDETPKPGDSCFERVRHRIVGTHDMLVEAAVAAATPLFRVRRLPSTEDDIVTVARRYAEERLEPGEILVSGGEPGVTLPSKPGRGGRNQQLALLMARTLFARGEPACFLAIGSDGSDGPTDAAGAIVDEHSWSGAADPESALARADAYSLLDSVGALVRTGATGTNVLDLHLMARA